MDSTIAPEVLDEVKRVVEGACPGVTKRGLFEFVAAI